MQGGLGLLASPPKSQGTCGQVQRAQNLIQASLGGRCVTLGRVSPRPHVEGTEPQHSHIQELMHLWG